MSPRVPVAQPPGSQHVARLVHLHSRPPRGVWSVPDRVSSVRPRCRLRELAFAFDRWSSPCRTPPRPAATCESSRPPRPTSLWDWVSSMLAVVWTASELHAGPAPGSWPSWLSDDLPTPPPVPLGPQQFLGAPPSAGGLPAPPSSEVSASTAPL